MNSNPVRMAMTGLLLLIGGCIEQKPEMAAQSRHNALAKLYPEGLAGMPFPSKAAALDYITAWMKVLEALGVSGLGNKDILERTYEDELLPIIAPLKNGSEVEKRAYGSGRKVYEAASYVGARFRDEKPFDNEELNALLRYELGMEADPAALSKGLSDLYFDYVEMVSPLSFKAGMLLKDAFDPNSEGTQE